MLEKISNKFEFDVMNERCWYYVGSEKKLVSKDLISQGNYNYQKVFQLDKEHKDFWINYSLTFSQTVDKVWFRVWYKKKIVDNSNPEGFKFIHYQKKLEKKKEEDIIAIEFTDLDEMVKVWDENKQKYKFVSCLLKDSIKN